MAIPPMAIYAGMEIAKGAANYFSNRKRRKELEKIPTLEEDSAFKQYANMVRQYATEGPLSGSQQANMRRQLTAQSQPSFNMARQNISTGSSANDGTGDTLRSAATKINANFTEIYTAIGDGTTISGIVKFADDSSTVTSISANGETLRVLGGNGITSTLSVGLCGGIGLILGNGLPVESVILPVLGSILISMVMALILSLFGL